MTRDEAEALAVQRWGTKEARPATYPRQSGAVQCDGTLFGRGFKVGVWIEPTPLAGYFHAHGEGASWVAAFDDADRRLGTPRKEL